MANDLQKKSKQTTASGKPAVTEEQPVNHPVNSGTFPLTAEQRQILGNVYQLLLSWRRERLLTTTPQSALNASSMLVTERQA